MNALRPEMPAGLPLSLWMFLAIMVPLIVAVVAWCCWPASWWPRRRGHGPHARVLYGTPQDHRTSTPESGPYGTPAVEVLDETPVAEVATEPELEPQWWELPVPDTEPAPVFAATGPVPALDPSINPNTIGWNREEMLLRIYAHGRGGGA